MADKIREAAFSVLWSLGIQPHRVLDLYAGSGSVGIEALSRGADHADFVEQARDAVSTIRQNLTSTDLEGAGQVHNMPVQRFIDSVREPYDFIIMDPPYADPDIRDVIEKVSFSGAVESGSVLLIGHAPYLELPEQVGRFRRLRERCHGDSCFSIFEIEDDAAEAESRKV